ncbi:MAG: hypothetical protein ABI778_04500 [Ignavibacteriota bacterium]
MIEKSQKAEHLVAQRFREEIENIHECKYCNSSYLMGGVTSPQSDGKNRIIFCLNQRHGGVILSRFEYNPA